MKSLSGARSTELFVGTLANDSTIVTGCGGVLAFIFIWIYSIDMIISRDIVGSPEARLASYPCQPR
jgi:hypothetical protein